MSSDDPSHADLSLEIAGNLDGQVVTGGIKAKKVHVGDVHHHPAPPPPPKSLWNVPRRDSYFTGRADVLAELHEALRGGGRAVLGQAIQGLGGIGKTQTAVEYCHRHREGYAAVFWIRSETEAAVGPPERMVV